MNRKIQVTKNYRLFMRSDENRPLDLRKHKKLFESMKNYGFLACFPVVCFRNKAGDLIIKDGQHRHAIAESLGLSVFWVEEEVDFDVAVINCTSKVWTTRDYAQKYAANGIKDYQEGLDFADRHHLAIAQAFSLLGGTASFTNVKEAFNDGTFRIKDREWAEGVASIYGPLLAMGPALNNARFVEACMAVCRVETFDPKRLLQNAERCREKLVAYSTRDAYLLMLDDIYNYARKHLVGLKVLATMAMRDRNATVVSKKKAEKKATATAAI